MDGQRLQTFMHKVANEELFRRRLEQAATLESVLGILSSEGLEMGAEEFRAAMRLLLFLTKAPAGELDEDELDNVAGGMNPAAFALMQGLLNANRSGAAAAAGLAASWQGRLGPGRGERP